MKKTIILSKGGLDAVATARNIIMELYSALCKNGGSAHSELRRRS